MTLTTSTGALSLLAQLALADPYTALDNSDASDCDDVQRSLDAAASINVATAGEPRHVTGSQSSAATQSPVSALQMLEQLTESPSSHRTSQKNGTAVSGYQSAAAAAARVVIEPASDWQIIGDFCSRTVSRKWLRLVLHGWHQAIKSKIKWRCIEQVCPWLQELLAVGMKVAWCSLLAVNNSYLALEFLCHGNQSPE
jgi:hypothetical protein